MRRRGRFEPEATAQLALCRLAAPHRFGDQLVGQNQPGVGDIFHHQQDIQIFAMQIHGIALDASERAAEPLAP